VLGEERRIGANPLPIDRWMVERLHGESGRRPRRSTLPPVAWHGRFAPSVRSAEPDLVLPPVVEPPAATTAPPSALPDGFDTPLDDVIAPIEEPRTIDALHLDAFVAPMPSAPVVDEPEFAPEPELLDLVNVELPAPAAPDTIAPSEPLPELDLWGAHEPRPEQAITPRPIVPHSQLDPEVRALVDDLYDQARAELSGAELAPEPEFEPMGDRFDADEPEAPIAYAPPVQYAPEPVAPPTPATSPPVLAEPAPVIEPPADPTPSASDSGMISGSVDRPARSGWVPAFVA
jgi:hypothetical protein